MPLPSHSYFNKRATSIRLEYASGVGLDLGPSSGDFSVGPINGTNTALQEVMDRGSFSGLTKGDDLIQDWSVTLLQTDDALTSAVKGLITDFLLQAGTFAGAVSLDANSEIPVFSVIVTYEENGQTATLTLPHAVGQIQMADGDPTNTIALSGRNFVAPTFE